MLSREGMIGGFETEGRLGTDERVVLLWVGSVILVVNIIKFHRRMGFDERVRFEWIE